MKQRLASSPGQTIPHGRDSTDLASAGSTSASWLKGPNIFPLARMKYVGSSGGVSIFVQLIWVVTLQSGTLQIIDPQQLRRVRPESERRSGLRSVLLIG